MFLAVATFSLSLAKNQENLLFADRIAGHNIDLHESFSARTLVLL